MLPEDVTSTRCAFIPVYCHYDPEDGGEKKTPVLIMHPDTFELTALILDIDTTLFSQDELKDQFIEAYYGLNPTKPGQEKALDAYDIYPQMVNVLCTDDEEISIFICELYENTEPYFQENGPAENTSRVCYKQGIDDLIQGGCLETLTEKILIYLSEEEHISSSKDDNSSNTIELF